MAEITRNGFFLLKCKMKIDSLWGPNFFVKPSAKILKEHGKIWRFSREFTVDVSGNSRLY